MRARSLVLHVSLALLTCFSVACKKGQQSDQAPAKAASSGPACGNASPSACAGCPSAGGPGCPVSAKQKSALTGNEKFVTTPTGLKYVVVVEGKGAQAAAGKIVSVHYTGWLENGTKFDSSRDRGKPIDFPLGRGRVIKGWDEGIAGMRVGGKRKLVIPANLAYGSRQRGPIPANSTLVFETELVAVK